MINVRINIAYVVNNHGSKFYGRWVIPIFKQQDGAFLCRFTGKYKEYTPVTFEAEDLISTKEFKEKDKDEEIIN